MIDPLVICIFSLFSAAHMIYTGLRKYEAVMRWRWCFAAVPFLWWFAVYGWIRIFNPPAEQYIPWVRSGIFCLLLLSFVYFIVDLVSDFRLWSKHRGQ